MVKYYFFISLLTMVTFSGCLLEKEPKEDKSPKDFPGSYEIELLEDNATGFSFKIYNVVVDGLVINSRDPEYGASIKFHMGLERLEDSDLNPVLAVIFLDINGSDAYQHRQVEYVIDCTYKVREDTEVTLGCLCNGSDYEGINNEPYGNDISYASYGKRRVVITPLSGYFDKEHDSKYGFNKSVSNVYIDVK